jgi:hypothetical protein
MEETPIMMQLDWQNPAPSVRLLAASLATPIKVQQQ